MLTHAHACSRARTLHAHTFARSRARVLWRAQLNVSLTRDVHNTTDEPARGLVGAAMLNYEQWNTVLCKALACQETAHLFQTELSDMDATTYLATPTGDFAAPTAMYSDQQQRLLKLFLLH